LAVAVEKRTHEWNGSLLTAKTGRFFRFGRGSRKHSKGVTTMAKQRKAWMLSPGKKPKASLPGTLKDEVDIRAGDLIQNALKPKHVQPTGV
jgi:hypothetical protein